MFGIGTTELIIIMLVALVVLGPKQLPGIARSLGKALGEFRRVTTDVQRTLNLEAAKIEEEERDKKKAASAASSDSGGNIPPPNVADSNPYDAPRDEASTTPAQPQAARPQAPPQNPDAPPQAPSSEVAEETAHSVEPASEESNPSKSAHSKAQA